MHLSLVVVQSIFLSNLYLRTFTLFPLVEVQEKFSFRSFFFFLMDLLWFQFLWYNFLSLDDSFSGGNFHWQWLMPQKVSTDGFLLWDNFDTNPMTKHFYFFLLSETNEPIDRFSMFFFSLLCLLAQWWLFSMRYWFYVYWRKLLESKHFEKALKKLSWDSIDLNNYCLCELCL